MQLNNTYLFKNCACLYSQIFEFRVDYAVDLMSCDTVPMLVENKCPKTTLKNKSNPKLVKYLSQRFISKVRMRENQCKRYR